MPINKIYPQSKELQFLTSAEGIALYNQYKDFPDAELERLLLKMYDRKIPYLPDLVTLVKLRRKAGNKFSKSSEMLFTDQSLSQSTSEAIADYTAKRFQGMKKVVDLTCGIGGNLLSLAKNVNQAVGVDKNNENIEYAKVNAEVYGIKNIEFVTGDAYDNIRSDADAFFIDPSRVRTGKTKTRSVLNAEPNLLEILPKIFKVTENVCVKISPAFDYDEINLLPEKPEIEIISEDNVCKVALLWFGKFKTCERRATCLIKGKIYTYQNSEKKIKIEVVKNPEKYLYEPNKAIIKAHLIEEVAKEFNLKKINKKTSFLTSDELITDKKELFRVFKVMYFDKFSLKDMKKKLREKKIERINIMTKRFPQKPEEIYKKIKIKEGGDWVMIITVFADEKNHYILAGRG